MTLNFYIEYLINTKFLKRVRDLLKNLCGLELELLDISGNIVDFANTQSTSPSLSINRIKNNFSEQKIKTEYLSSALETKEITIFEQPLGYKRILVPVIFRSEVIGFLYTGETKSSSLLGSQIQSISVFLKDMIDQISNNDMQFCKEFKGNDLTHQRRSLNKVVEYIENNYHSKDLTLEKVSKENGISYHYLSRLFKQELKTNFSSFVNNLRIDVASRLLKDQSLSIGQVSYSCGFDDPGYFSKVFKKNRGTTPVDYRSKVSSRSRRTK